MDRIKLKVAKEFSRTPGPRYKREGSHSGELFREDILFPFISRAIKENCVLSVDLDGALGYGTSFLEEAFGGLIRENKIAYELILKHLEIISIEEDYLINDILQYLKEAHEKK
jgi:hypothetical protein